MEPNETHALIQMCRLRFRSFSEAADSILASLAEAVPGALVLGKFEPEQGACRVIGVAGDEIAGLGRGSSVPLAGDELDRGFLGTVGVESCSGIPLELRDGRVVGTVAALSAEPEVYGDAAIVMLGIAARMLSFEWDALELRAEMQRLRTRLPAGESVDTETALPNRESFLALVEHELLLARRGTVESVLVVFEVGAGAGARDGADAGGSEASADAGAASSATDKLALKLAAETLGGCARTTDRIGRIGPQELAVILIGCPPEQATAFVDRYLAAIERVNRGGGPQIRLSHGVVSLAAVSSPEQAVELATEATGAAPGPPTGTPREPEGATP